MTLHRTLSSFAVCAALAGCTTSAPTPTEPAPETPFVSQIQLSRTFGEVGRPFQAEIDFAAKRLRDPQLRVGSLPPGLRFDAEKGAIVGVPEHAGFYSVTVGVRNQVDSELQWNTVETAWHTQEFEIAIYAPVEGRSEVGPVAEVGE